MFKDKIKNKSQVIYANVLASKPSWIRLDLNTSLGMVVGSIVADDTKFMAVNMLQKKFINGPSEPSAIAKAVIVPISPSLVIQALFEIEPPGTDWSCTKDKKDLLKECLNGRTKALITWSSRQGSRRIIGFSDKNFDVQLDLMNYQPNVQIQEAQMKLESPKGFQIIRL